MFLGVAFPSPANPTFGIWALRQAQAIRRAGTDIQAIRFTPWFPAVIRNHRRIRRVADAPATHQWGDLGVKYFRWPLYQAGGAAKTIVRKSMGASKIIICLRARGPSAGNWEI